MFGSRNMFPMLDGFINRFAGSASNYEREFLKARMSRSRSFEQHDFNRSVTADITNTWTVLATSTATTWAMLAESGGWVRGVTGTSVATGAVGLHAANKMWNGTNGAGFASLIRLSAVTDIRLEMGFVDVAPAVGVTAINYASVAFNSVTSGAVYLYDNGVAASATVSGLFTVGVSTAIQTVATTTNRYASGVTLFVAMEIVGSRVSVWAGNGNEPVATITAAFAATESWVPWFQAKTASGSKNVDVDALWTWTVSGRS